MAPLKGFTWKSIEQTNLELEVQAKLLHMTYFFTANLKHAPSLAYQRLFLKHILKLCEESGSEISDQLYEAYTEVLSRVEQSDDKCYKSYTLPCGGLITLKETQQFISQGTTGLCTWMAGEYLAEWALENMANFHQRNIIELGCGTGLTGLVICSASSPCQYIFTDCHKQVLEALQCNLELNGFVQFNKASDEEEYSCGKTSAACESNIDEILETSPSSSMGLIGNSDQRDFHTYPEMVDSCTQDLESDIKLQYNKTTPNCTKCAIDNITGDSFGWSSSKTVNVIAHYARKSACYRHLNNKDCVNHSGNVQVDVCKLEWGTVKKRELTKCFGIGIILAADVVYDVELIPPLVKTLHILLSTCGDNSGKPVAYVASTIRNPQTYEFFVTQLSEHNINWSEENKPRDQVFYYDHSCDIKIVKLQM